MPKTRKFAGLAALGTAMLAGAAFGAAPAHAADTRPAPPLEPLSMFTGGWHCSGASISPDGSRTDFESESNVEFVLNGNVQRWKEEVSTVAGDPLASIEYLWAWDARRKKFLVDEFDSFGQRTELTTRGWVRNTITLRGTTTQADGTSFATQIELTKKSQSAFTVQAVFWVNGPTGPVDRSESSCTR